MSKKLTLAESEPKIRKFLDLLISRAGFALTYTASAGKPCIRISKIPIFWSVLAGKMWIFFSPTRRNCFSPWSN